MDRPAEQEKPVIKISVRALVEFLRRSGDLRARRGGFAERDAMQAGSRIHRKLQKKRGGAYQAEVPLRFEKEYERFVLVIEGRADGIRTDSRGAVIEEIKGVYADPERITEPVPVHLAQAMCYAFFYCLENSPDCENGAAIKDVHPAALPNAQTVRVCMTYVQMETEQEKNLYQEFTYEELEAWFTTLLEEYRVWVEFSLDWAEKRDASMQHLEFPYPYRKGQREMVADVYRTIARGKQLFVQAPTGIGKTMSAVFPAVRAIGGKKADRLFYLTAKTITRTVAEEAFTILAEHGLLFKAMTITAKEKICACKEVNCDPEVCPRAKGHYDRVNSAMFEMLTEGKSYDRPALEAQAEKWQVCPFEMQLDLAEFMDGVICDYNYVFDPDARLKRFFGETASRSGNIFLIDEAHNLADRGREMFSARIGNEEINEARTLVRAYRKTLEEKAGRIGRRKKKKAEQLTFSFLQETSPDGTPEDPAAPGEEAGTAVFSPESPGTADLLDEIRLCERLEAALAACRNTLLHLRERCGEITLLQEGELGDLMTTLPVLTGFFEDLLSEMKGEEERKELLEFYFRLLSFSNIHDLVDESYLIYGEPSGGKDLQVVLFCVNPATNLQVCLDKGVSTVFFSATLLPVTYYQHLLTTKTDSYAVYIDSPFDQSRRLLTIGRDVSTVYRRRTHDEFVRIASYIRLVTEKKAGNYMVYFPSYQMLNQVYEIYRDHFAEEEEIPLDEIGSGTDLTDTVLRSVEKNSVRLLVQTQNMSEQEREEFLQAFSENSGADAGTLIGFCVMGGIFSEGIDLAGEKLIGAVVVGTGIPQIGAERELLRGYYEEEQQRGFDYAYRYPGLNKVLQAAGRVIRSTEDTGVIVLLDSRFTGPEYRQLFPREWADIRTCTLETVGEQVGEFWEKEGIRDRD